MYNETQTRARLNGAAAAHSTVKMQAATVVLICPDESRRRFLTRALHAQQARILAEVDSYPAYHQMTALVDADCDAFMVEVDSDSDAALNLIETLCSRKPSATIIVYAANHDPDLLVGSMRAGAREFLHGAIAPNELCEALLRASARRVEHAGKKALGTVTVFWGAKGGAGTTTLAANYAIALRQETGGKVALVDLHPQLGDVAVLLGVNPQFTIADALLNPSRLDEDFVSSLATGHNSGISVIAAPDAYRSDIPVETETVQRLLDLVRNQYPHVVVDCGAELGESADALFQGASAVYVVSQVDIPSLRNSQRLIAYLQGRGVEKLELVLNRFEPRKTEFDDERLAKAVGLKPRWKVPNDFAAARRASNTGTPLMAEKSPVGDTLRQMARVACGKKAESEKKRSFSIFGA